MRYFDQGSGYRVSFSREDAANFTKRWPCSTVQGPGWLEFAANGDLVDRGGKYSDADGPEWVAFSQDCQAYGIAQREKQT